MTMLDRMRRHKGWLKWSLAIVVLTFILLYIPDFLNDPAAVGAAPSEVIASVEGNDVTAGQFQRRYQSQMQAYQQAYGGNINAQMLRQLGIENQILQQMVDEQAALAEAERQGISVSDEELAAQIFSIPAFQENGRFIGEQRYEQILRTQRPPMTKGDFEENLRKSMKIDKFRSALTDWISMNDAEVEREFRERNEKVKLQLVALTADKFRDKVTVTDADIQKYYDDHKAEFRVGERRKIKYLLVDMDQIRAKTVVTPNDVQTYYSQNSAQYSQPAQIRASHILLKTEGKDDATIRKQAEEILKQVKAGGDFAELAKKHSEDEGSKVNGGDLDYFGRGRMVPEFENAAFALEPGQVSDLVKTQYGYHIIKVVDKKPAITRSIDEVRAQITEQLKFQKAQEAVTAQAQALDDKIDDPSDLDRVAKESGFPVRESDFFAREEPIPGLGMSPQVAEEAFRLKDGEVGGPVQSPRGPIFLGVTGKRDPFVPPFAEAKDKARDAAIRARAAELSRQRAGEIATKLRAAKDFAAAVKAEGLEAKDTELITRGSALPDIGTSAEIEKVVFSLPQGSVSEPIPTATGTVIVRVVERDDVTPEEVTTGIGSFREQLLGEHRGRFFSSYMSKAKEKMKIEINDEVLKRVVGP